jgi:hypothetical protein
LKYLVLPVLLLPLYATTIGIADAQEVCIRTRDIDSSISSPTSIIFKLRDGRVVRNDLKGICPGLRFSGYSFVMHDLDEICDSEVAIQVMNSGEVCVLGKFSDVTPPHVPGH